MTRHVGLVLLLFHVRAGTPVQTRSYDNARTGANTSEVTFTPAKVAANGLKKLYSLDIHSDPRLEAQPLYAPGLDFNGVKHNALFVATMANEIFAFDADTGKPIWAQPASLGPAFHPPASIKDGHRHTAIDEFGINIKWGILSTPVLDLDAQSMYVVNWGLDGAGKRELRLNVLRLRDGQTVKPFLKIQASQTNAAGHVVTLRPDQKQRAALLLTPLRGPHKKLFVAMSGGENPASPNGWIVAFDVDSFQQKAAWISTPSSFGGGIWQASQGPASDDAGNIYFMTGNGGYTTANGATTEFNGKTDFAEAFVKLNYSQNGAGKGTFTLKDWFIPFLDSKRKEKDQDLGSGAPILTPGMNMVLGAGKDGVIYVMDRNNMGKVVADFSKLKSVPIFFTYFPGFGVSGTGNLDPAGQIPKTHHLHGSPIFWKSPDRGPLLFVWGENESLRAWTLDATGKVVFLAKSAEIASHGLADPATPGEGGMPGGMITLSADPTKKNTGIVWTTAPINEDANKKVVEGIVRAYDGATLDTHQNDDGTPRLKLLWDSTKIANNRFAFAKFCPPFVADGKLFVPTYGSWPDTPTNRARIDVYVLQ